MSEAARRVPIEPGFFTIPDDPAEPPRLLGSRCRACGEHFFPRREICAKCLQQLWTHLSKTAARQVGRFRHHLDRAELEGTD